MSLKAMNGKLMVSAFVALTAASMAVGAVGCGGSDDDEKDSGGTPGEDGGTPTSDGGGVTPGSCTGTRDPKQLTLVTVLANDPSGFIGTPHEVELVSATDGKPFNPPLTTTTEKGTGGFTFKNVPCDTKAWIHVKGVGPASDPKSTYDSLSLDAPDSGEVIIRASTVGTAATAEMTGGFKSKDDEIAIGGAVYTVDSKGKRTGSVGCATVHIDDASHPAMANDQRYIASTGLPTTLDKQSKTLRSGKFYFGNIKPGTHKFKVSVDGGQTFLKQLNGTDTLEVFLPFARKDATSDFKSFLVLMGIDIPGADPTPKDCPAQ